MLLCSGVSTYAANLCFESALLGCEAGQGPCSAGCLDGYQAQAMSSAAGSDTEGDYRAMDHDVLLASSLAAVSFGDQ